MGKFNKKSWIVIVLLLVFTVGIIGCAGEEGAEENNNNEVEKTY